MTNNLPDDGLLSPPEDRVFKGRSSWNVRTVDQKVLELAFDQRLRMALRRCSSVFLAANMSYTSELLRTAAAALERLEEPYE